MTHTGQREVPVKKRWHYAFRASRTLAFLVIFALTPLSARAENDAGVDAPRLPTATRLDNGSVLLSPEAYTAVDLEMKRLQAVERDAKLAKAQPGAAQWVIPLIIGALAGAAIAVPVTLALAPSASK